jgi:hypothetical protein
MKTSPYKRPAIKPPPPQPLRQRILKLPSTRQGWWSVVMAVIFIVLYLLNSTVFMPTTVNASWRQTLLPFYSMWMMLCGLAAGIAGLVAMTRQGERSLLVWLAMLPGLMALFLVIGEFVVPH